MDTNQPDTFVFRDLCSRRQRGALALSLILLGLAYISEYFADAYALVYTIRPTSVAVGDIILDSVPAIDLNFIIIQGAFISIVIGTLYVLSKPRYVLFTLNALALFVIIRALCISLTHIGMYPDHIAAGSGVVNDVYRYLDLQLGLFFSGHTGLPFLMGLIFWNKPSARYAFFTLSFVFAVAVLLAHVHYSIDVFAAPFMAYGIYHLSRRLFVRDYRLIEAAP